MVHAIVAANTNHDEKSTGESKGKNGNQFFIVLNWVEFQALKMEILNQRINPALIHLTKRCKRPVNIHLFPPLNWMGLPSSRFVPF